MANASLRHSAFCHGCHETVAMRAEEQERWSKLFVARNQ